MSERFLRVSEHSRGISRAPSHVFLDEEVNNPQVSRLDADLKLIISMSHSPR